MLHSGLSTRFFIQCKATSVGVCFETKRDKINPVCASFTSIITQDYYSVTFTIKFVIYLIALFNLYLLCK